MQQGTAGLACAESARNNFNNRGEKNCPKKNLLHLSMYKQYAVHHVNAVFFFSLSLSWLVSHWIFTSCQLHTVTSGQSNSVISKHTQSKTSHIQTLSQVSPQNQSLHKHKTYMYAQTHIFEELVVSILPHGQQEKLD